MPPVRRVSGTQPVPQTRGVRPQRMPRSGGNTAASTAAPLAAATGPSAGVLLGGAIAGALTVAQIRAIVTGVVRSVRAAAIIRRLGLVAYVQEAVAEVFVDMPRRMVDRIVRDELRREDDFRRRQLGRLRRDLPRALAEPDERKRDKRVQGVLGRERHYSHLHEEHSAARAAGAADAAIVEALSPEGAVWELGPRTHHTPGCAFLHGKALNWTAIRALRAAPPAGPGCGCRLRGLNEAWRMALTPEQLAPPTVEVSARLIWRARALEVGHGHGGGVLVEASLAR